MTRSAKIDVAQYAFENEDKPSKEEIARRIKENAPKGYLHDKKWTGKVLECPACHQQSFDQYEGGANLEEGEVTHPAFLYYCRVCNLGLTEEQFFKATL